MTFAHCRFISSVHRKHVKKYRFFHSWKLGYYYFFSNLTSCSQSTDGKTLNHCFIEMRNLTAAHFIVRHRHGTKIGTRPCSVVLTSSVELHSKVLDILHLSWSFHQGKKNKREKIEKSNHCPLTCLTDIGYQRERNPAWYHESGQAATQALRTSCECLFSLKSFSA